MRTFFPALVLVLVSATLASADGSYRADASQVPSLPPGLWFRAGHYEDFRLENEPAAPTHAVIAGRFVSDARAEAASRRVDRTRVGLGYPWIVANHDLRVAHACRDEIVVVVGLFTSERDARAWRAADPSRRAHRIAALDPEDGASCAWGYGDDGEILDPAGRHREVIQIEPTRDAPGYRRSDLEQIDTMDFADGQRARAALTATCSVPRGSIHSFDDEHAMFRFGWRYAPARCGREVVYVPVEHTMRATLLETQNGNVRLLQITDVSCDSPAWDEWSYSIDGRQEIAGEPPTFTAPCAG